MGLSDTEVRALVHARETGEVRNSHLRELTGEDTLTASKALQKLRDRGLLEAHGASVNTYYTPTAACLEPVSSSTQGQLVFAVSGESNVQDEPVDSPYNDASSPYNDASSPYNDDKLEEIAKPIRSKRRVAPAPMRSVILTLCEVRPLTSGELAALLGRNEVYLQDHVLRAMIREGALFFLYDNPTHPQQRYTTQRIEASSPHET